MKVALISPYDMGIPGGVQDQVLRLSRWLRGEGHQVSLIGPGECDDPGFVSAGPVAVVPANGAATPLALTAQAGRRVLDALARVDVAHVHEPLMPQVSLTALRKASIPMVGTFHADPSSVAEWVYRVGRPLTSRWFRRLNVITAVSPIAARVVDDTHRVRIIPNGLDVDDYAPHDKRSGSVVFLGRDDERKGLSVLLEAWPTIRAAHPSARLTVVGAENPGAITAGVEFLGRVSEAAKHRHLQEGLVFCAPNLSGESFGIVVVEAMAAACAVVATALPAFVHVARENARFVARHDAVGIAQEVTALLNDEAEAIRLGRGARTASHRYDMDSVAAAYLDTYRQAVADVQ